jgi:hypothetical protein
VIRDCFLGLLPRREAVGLTLLADFVEMPFDLALQFLLARRAAPSPWPQLPVQTSSGRRFITLAMACASRSHLDSSAVS